MKVYVEFGIHNCIQSEQSRSVSQRQSDSELEEVNDH